jgi:hypothetical protein
MSLSTAFLAFLLLLSASHAFLSSQATFRIQKSKAFLSKTHVDTARSLSTNTAFGTSVVTSRRHPLVALQQQQSSPSDDNDDDEWHPHDPAETTPQLLAALWFMIAHGNSLVKGETMTVIFPELSSQINSPAFMDRVMGHLDTCKDICDSFGTQTVLLPYVKQGKVQGFTVKSYRNPNKNPDDYEFDYDPFWDDGIGFNHEGVDDEYEDGPKNDPYPKIVNRIPDDDDEIISTTKRWVDKMMSDMGICPFTNGPDLSGMPMGNVFYAVDRCTQIEDMYARFWKEVVRVEQHNQKDISTTLLIAPEFLIDNIELFETFSNTLTQPLAALQIEELCQLIFFHPLWTFRDGAERSGIGAAANYARRSPWPMINILRTKQVRTAQKGIPTGLVYKQNEKTLNAIGTDKLETMLRLRDWSDIADVKVDRKDMEALRVARDFQQTGSVKKEDMSFAYDSTPAANKVDRSQIEGGNMLNVVKQALEKRLGKESGEVTRLSGPETSAAVMASDFLLEELDRIASTGKPEPSEAHRMLMDDLAGGDSHESMERGSEEMEVLFGKSGIMESDRDSEDFSSGLNPSSFY